MATNSKSEDIRRMIFDPNVPDWAFITEDDLSAVFDCGISTIQKWRKEARFPPPIGMPGGAVYTMAAIREFLKKRAAESKKAAQACLK